MIASRNSVQQETIPLCVDLDGTLILSDLLYESFLAAFKKNPLTAFLCLGWLTKGKAVLKAELAAKTEIDCSALPYNQPLLNYLEEQKETGRCLILATASNKKFADGVAKHLGLFSQVFASSESVNLSGARKRAALEKAFPATGYAYIGNDEKDFQVWEGASIRLAANASPSVLKRLEQTGPVDRIFARNRSCWNLIKAIRAHQWLKNLLIFVPLVAAHKCVVPELVGKACIAFVSFSATASSVYLLNDLADLEYDRLHPRKKNRPLAAGLVSIPWAAAMIVLMLGIATGLSFLLPTSFQLILLGYYVLTCIYSFHIKRILLFDVIVLAALYTMRLLAGGSATETVLSIWMLAFSSFLFLSLALVKRYIELREAADTHLGNPCGRGYRLEDINQIATLGSCSGMVSIVVLALYANSPQVQILYRSPMALLLLCPVILYWISRIWILAGRKEIHEDPVMFAAKDRVSYIVCAVAALILFLATFLH